MSETDRSRKILSQFCVGNGIDIGYGGDPIVPTAITIDLQTPYTKVGNAPQNLVIDGISLYWFNDEVLDYVYSSHLLEDFDDVHYVIREWCRVLKPGGHLILLCPDEQAYRNHCLKNSSEPNHYHKHENFSLTWLLNELKDDLDNFNIIHSTPLINDYSFELVLQKKLRQ